MLITIIFLNLLLGIFIIAQNPRSISNILFSILALVAAVWTFMNYMTSISISILWLNSSYAFGSLVIGLGLLWTLSIRSNKLDNKKFFFITIFSLTFFIFSYIPGFLIESYKANPSNIVSSSTAGAGIFLYVIYYLFITYLIIKELDLEYKSQSNYKEKARIKLILIGACIALFTSFISTILPFALNITICGIDAVGFLIFLLFITYAITKYSLFNIKIVAAELILFGLWLFIFFHILLSTNPYQMTIEAITFIISIILGVILIRNIFHSMNQDRKIEELSSNLRNAYSKIKELSGN